MSYQEIYTGITKRASAEQVKELAHIIGMRKRASGPVGDTPPPPPKTRTSTGGKSAIPRSVIKEKASSIGGYLQNGALPKYPWKKPAPLMDPIYPKSNWQLLKGKLGQLFTGRAEGATTADAIPTAVNSTTSGSIPKPTSGAVPKIKPRFAFRSRRSAKLFGKTPRLLRFAKRHPVMSVLGTLLALGGTGAVSYGLGSAGKSDLQSALHRTQVDNSKYVAQNNRLKTKGSGSLLQDFLNMLKFWYNRWFSGDRTEASSTATNNTQGTK